MRTGAALQAAAAGTKGSAAGFGGNKRETPTPGPPTGPADCQARAAVALVEIHQPQHSTTIIKKCHNNKSVIQISARYIYERLPTLYTTENEPDVHPTSCFGVQRCFVVLAKSKFAREEVAWQHGSQTWSPPVGMGLRAKLSVG